MTMKYDIDDHVLVTLVTHSVPDNSPARVVEVDLPHYELPYGIVYDNEEYNYSTPWCVAEHEIVGRVTEGE